VTPYGLHNLITEAHWQLSSRGLIVAMQKKAFGKKENADAK